MGRQLKHAVETNSDQEIEVKKRLYARGGGGRGQH